MRRLGTTLGAILMILIFAGRAWGATTSPVFPGSFSYYDLTGTLAPEISSLNTRGATDVRSFNKPYATYFFQKSAVRREEFYSMLARAFRLPPSWEQSPYSDYSPNRGARPYAMWFNGDERPIVAIELESNGGYISFEIWELYDNNGYPAYYYWYASGNQPQFKLTLRRNNVYGLWIYSSTSSFTVKKIYYADGTEKTVNIGVNRWSWVLIPDVNHYYPWVMAAFKAGWASGYPDGTFKPDASMTRLDLMVAVAKAMGYEDFARSLSKRQVDAILARFSDSWQIPDDLRPLTAVLVLSNITRGSGKQLLPFSTGLREHAAAFIERAVRVDIEAMPPRVSLDGQKPQVQFRFSPGWPYKLVAGQPWSLTIARLPEAGWEQTVDRLSGTQTIQNAADNQIVTTWTPRTELPAGIYMAQAQIYAKASTNSATFVSPYAPFELVYHTLQGSAAPNRVRPGEVVTVSALTAGDASRVTVTVPIPPQCISYGGGAKTCTTRQTLDMAPAGDGGTHPIYGIQDAWRFAWLVPDNLQPGQYTLTLRAYYSDGTPSRTATVTVEVYEPFTPRCNPLEHPVWAEPNKAVTVGCTDTTSGGQVVSGYASLGGRTYALTPQSGRRWMAAVPAPASPGSHSVTLILQVRDNTGWTTTHTVPLTLIVIPPGQTPGQGMETIGPLPGFPGRVRLIE